MLVFDDEAEKWLCEKAGIKWEQYSKDRPNFLEGLLKGRIENAMGRWSRAKAAQDRRKEKRKQAN